jgi:hypothetical protein
MLQEEFGIQPARETAALAEHISHDRLPQGPGEAVTGPALVRPSPLIRMSSYQSLPLSVGECTDFTKGLDKIIHERNPYVGQVVAPANVCPNAPSWLPGR